MTDSLAEDLLALAEAADGCGLHELATEARSALKRNKRKRAPESVNRPPSFKSKLFSPFSFQQGRDERDKPEEDK